MQATGTRYKARKKIKPTFDGISDEESLPGLVDNVCQPRDATAVEGLPCQDQEARCSRPRSKRIANQLKRVNQQAC